MRLIIPTAIAALALGACVHPADRVPVEPAEDMTVPPENDADQLGVDDTAIDEEELGEDEPDSVVLDDETVEG